MGKWSNEDMDSIFGVKHPNDVIRKTPKIFDEAVIKRPNFPTSFRDGKLAYLPPEDRIYMDCPTCLRGSLLVDKKLRTQFRVCSICKDIYAVKANGAGEFTSLRRWQNIPSFNKFVEKWGNWI